MNRAALLVGTILLSAGCVPQQGRRDTFTGVETKAVSDAFGGLAPAPKPQGKFKSLSVGVILSENSKRAAEGNQNNGGVAFRSVEYSTQALFDGYVKLLQDSFKSAARVESVAEAKAAGLDLAVVLDLWYEYPQGIFTTAKCSAILAFMTPDGAKIETVRGEGAKHPRDTPGFLALPRMKKAVEDASAQCRAGVERGLAESVVLAARASGTAQPAPQAQPAPEAAIASDVDAPAYRLAPSDRGVALVIGIDRYETLPRAEFAERDAAAVRGHLSALGFPDRNIVFLTGAKAGKAAIEKYVESWLPRNVDGSSRVFVYFSGHGSPDVRTGEAYLMPWDADAKFTESTGYPLSRLYGKLNALKAKSVVVAMDACFSGAGGRSVLARGLRPLVATVDTGSARVGSVGVLAASAADEVTGAEVAQGHGLFTYYLLKGLNERKGAATLSELFQYLSPRVRDAARRDNRDQTPQLLGPAEVQASRFN
jgi:hypothetical protein